MTSPSNIRFARRILAVWLCASALCTLLIGGEKKSFAIPAGTADKSLRQFIAQSGAEVVYPAEVVRGVKTPAVKGELTPEQAIQQLLTDTSLSVKQDAQSKTFMISRDPNANGGETPQQRAPRLRPQSARQDSPDGPPRVAVSAPDLEAVQLSPFEVRTDRDVGYTAASALAGGRTAMDLKDIPAVVSVMPREFIDDIAATNFLQISEWGVNSMPEYSPGIAHNPGAFFIQLRGPNGSFPSRNYFIWYVNSDSYATERYEFSRGPNGVLFGDGSPGGIVTIFSKQARFGKSFYSLNLRGDSWGGFNTRVDLNQPVNDKVAIRLNLLDVRDEHWRDRNSFRNEGAHLAATFRLANRTTFRLEGEIGRNERKLAALSYLENSSYWDGSTFYDGVTPPSASGTGVSRNSANVYNVWIPGVPQAGISNWGNSYRTTGSNFRIWPEPRPDMDTDMPVLPSREFNIQPENSGVHFKFHSYNFYLEHRFTENLFAQLAYSRLVTAEDGYNSSVPSSYAIDLNRLLPGTTIPNPKFKVPYSESGINRSGSGNRVDDVRAIVSYKLEYPWFKSAINGIAGSRIDRYRNRNEQLYITNGAIASFRHPSNEIRQRFYWDEPGAYALPTDGIPNVPGFAFGWFENNFAHSDQRKTIDYVQVATATQLFKNRLTLLMGARRDGFNGFSQGAQFDGNVLVPGATIVRPDGVSTVFIPGGRAQVKVRPVSSNAGVVYFILPSVGIYANYSETFATPNSGTNLLNAGQPGVERSKGQDYGIKFILGHKIDARLNYYTTQQVDKTVGARRRFEIDRIWTNLGRSIYGDWRDTQTLDLQGWEFEMTANPTRNLRFIFNYATPKATNVDMYPRYHRYVAENLATWQAGANDPNNPRAAAIATDIRAIQTDLTTLTPGAVSNNTYKYTSNIYGTYTFGGNVLKNLSIGLGANLRGKAKVGNTAASAYDYLYAKSYRVLSGHVGYEKRFSRLSARWQLNVSNILDADEPVITAFGDFRANNVGDVRRIPQQFRYLDPRKFTLSMTLAY